MVVFAYIINDLIYKYVRWNVFSVYCFTRFNKNLHEEHSKIRRPSQIRFPKKKYLGVYIEKFVDSDNNTDSSKLLKFVDYVKNYLLDIIVENNT